MLALKSLCSSWVGNKNSSTLLSDWRQVASVLTIKMHTGLRNSQTSFPVRIAAFCVPAGAEISALCLVAVSARPVGSCPVLRQAIYKTRECRNYTGYRTMPNSLHLTRSLRSMTKEHTEGLNLSRCSKLLIRYIP